MAIVRQLPDRLCDRCKGMGLVSVPINEEAAVMRVCGCTLRTTTGNPKRVA